MPHGRHIYAKAFDIENATMYTYNQSDHVLPHWKCVLRCCAECQHINITDHNKKIITKFNIERTENDLRW